MDHLAEAVRRQIEANHDAVEAVCEQMLVQPGSRGVLVTDLPNGTVRAELSDRVPFGEVHYQRP